MRAPANAAFTKHPPSSKSKGKLLVAIGTLAVLAGLIVAIAASGIIGGSMMLVGFVVFVLGRLI